jgi:hypothetical protein
MRMNYVRNLVSWRTRTTERCICFSWNASAEDGTPTSQVSMIGADLFSRTFDLRQSSSSSSSGNL